MMNSVRMCIKLGRTGQRYSILCRNAVRFCSKITEVDTENHTKKKFKQFRDEDALTILDVEEERWKIKEKARLKIEDISDSDDNLQETFTRGKTGVFDIEDLMPILNEHKASNTFVAKIPKELHYVDYVVIVSAKSSRHILGLGEVVRKMFKQKRNSSDQIPTLEGESSDWVALDLGNIILHIMSNKCRRLYDLESLWGIGPKYDEQSNTKDDEITELLKLHSITLDDLVPRNATE